MSQCIFDKAWLGRCKLSAIDGSDRCEEHAPLKCCSCGAPATQSCDHTGQFVCGASLCAQCSHSPPEKGKGFGMFMMGGSHKTKTIANQEWTEYYADLYPETGPQK